MMAGKDDAIELVKMATNGLDTLVQEPSHTHTHAKQLCHHFLYKVHVSLFEKGGCHSGGTGPIVSVYDNCKFTRIKRDIEVNRITMISNKPCKSHIASVRPQSPSCIHLQKASLPFVDNANVHF